MVHANSKVLACLHVGSPSFPHDLITFIYRVVLIQFFVLGIFIFYFFIFYFFKLFFLSYPYFYFLFTLLARVLQVRRSGQTLIRFRRRVYVCIMYASLCLCVCLRVCVCYVLSHFHYYVCVRERWGGVA